MRTTLPTSRWRRVARVASFRADYPHRASGWKSMAMDLVLPKRNDETGSAAINQFSALDRR
jgi:hypothetical protein